MTTDAERLSPKAIRWLNKELEPRGLRVCRVCQGHPQSLDAEHFYRVGGDFQNICKTCQKAAVARRFQERYATDSAYREHRKASSASWRKSRPDYIRAYERERLPKRKQRRLSRVLEKGVS